MPHKNHAEAAPSIHDHLHTLGNDARQTASHVGEAVTGVAQLGVKRARELGQIGYDMAADKTRKANEAVMDFVDEKPWTALGVAAGAGFLLGAWMMRRR